MRTTSTRVFCASWVLVLLVVLAVVQVSRAGSTEQRTVLAIRTANAALDWNALEDYSSSWTIHQMELEGFEPIMAKSGFQAALEQYESQLRDALAQVQPDAILVASKGIGVLTFLATIGLWNGPAVLLSPIPNASNHVQGGSWESEWESTMQVLVSHDVGPLAIGVGTSVDEQDFIKHAIEETGICGKVTNYRFEKCRSYMLVSFPGNHYWKNEPKNIVNIGVLVDAVFKLQERATRRHVELSTPD